MRATIWLAATVAGAGLVTACKDSGPKIEPVNEAPNAKFSFSCAALRCEFNDSSTDDTKVAGWSWSFGDQTEANVRNPVHEYNNAGSYPVTLTVTDEEGETATVTHQALATLPVVTSLVCVDGTAPGGYVACTLTLQEEAGFKVVLNRSSCEAHGNVFRITAPEPGRTLTTDGCYEQAGKQLVYSAAFPAGTEISAQVVAPMLNFPPALVVSGNYPEWTLTYEDGVDEDFDDMVLTVTALPTGN
jgi:PKD repeat protein